MSMIKVKNLTFSYPGSYDPIFDKVCFQIDTRWKLGFIGRNGRGKTTFLRLLLGDYAYQGKILASVRFDYFPYEVLHPKRPTQEILHEICPLVEEWEFLREFSYLQVDEAVLERPFSTLSPGEQTKVLLAALFLQEGHFLLIDEPTNHLDTAARRLVASYLKRKKGFILVSHDRMLLDECADHILSLNKATIEVQNGNFSSWMENFERQQNFEFMQNEQLKKDMVRMQQAAKRSVNWSDRVEASKNVKVSGLKPDKGFVGHRAAKMMKRAKTLEMRQNAAIEAKAKLLKNVESCEDLKLSPLKHHAQTLVRLVDVAVIYHQEIGKRLHFTVQQGERVALEGGNGSGKSSILQLIVGKALTHTGKLELASGLIISYVPQDTSFLQGNLADFARINHIDESLFKTILRKMDFERAQFEKDLANFSAGQKKKVLIAKSLCERAHLYVWDEPLNFVDIYSRMQIERLLLLYSPTMIFVEHDQAFQNAIATRVIHL